MCDKHSDHSVLYVCLLFCRPPVAELIIVMVVMLVGWFLAVGNSTADVYIQAEIDAQWAIDNSKMVRQRL